MMGASVARRVAECFAIAKWSAVTFLATSGAVCLWRPGHWSLALWSLLAGGLLGLVFLGSTRARRYRLASAVERAKGYSAVLGALLLYLREGLNVWEVVIFAFALYGAFALVLLLGGGLVRPQLLKDQVYDLSDE